MTDTSTTFTPAEARAALRQEAERLSHMGAGTFTSGWRLALERLPHLAQAAGIAPQSDFIAGIDSIGHASGFEPQSAAVAVVALDRAHAEKVRAAKATRTTSATKR